MHEENTVLKQWNEDLKKKLEESYKNNLVEIQKRKSQLLNRSSISQANVNFPSSAQKKKFDTPARAIREAQNPDI